MVKKKKAVFITITDEDGNIIEEIPMTAANADWIRARRLKIRTEAGDKEAAKKLRELENTSMIYFEDE